MVKEFWDFNEHINYTIVNINGRNYKVIKKFKDYYYASLILDYIYKYILLICNYFKINYRNYSHYEQKLINCFLEIHPNNYLLSEMQLGTPFNGLNKPKKVYTSTKENIGKDGKLRAKYRDVFLTLRNDSGKFNNEKIIMKLVIHEITHTMCNHVTWRNDDHGKDFQHAEKLITSAYNKVKN
tara:strand:- start:780 stop:1325 length:546 start_codon:yes stop_codon:yes gene_type:complete